MVETIRVQYQGELDDVGLVTAIYSLFALPKFADKIDAAAMPISLIQPKKSQPGIYHIEVKPGQRATVEALLTKVAGVVIIQSLAE